jgi:hypothetical protein
MIENIKKHQEALLCFLEILRATVALLLLHIFHIVKSSFLWPLFRTIHRSINNNLFTSSKCQTRENKKKERKWFDEMPRKNDPHVKIDGGLFQGCV